MIGSENAQRSIAVTDRQVQAPQAQVAFSRVQFKSGAIKDGANGIVFTIAALDNLEWNGTGNEAAR